MEPTPDPRKQLRHIKVPTGMPGVPEGVTPNSAGGTVGTACRLCTLRSPGALIHIGGPIHRPGPHPRCLPCGPYLTVAPHTLEAG